jgi:hypothetical protein
VSVPLYDKDDTPLLVAAIAAGAHAVLLWSALPSVIVIEEDGGCNTSRGSCVIR